MLLCLLAICGCNRSDGPAKNGAEAPAKEIPLEASATVSPDGRPLGREALSLSSGAVRIWYADLGDNLGIRVVSRDIVVVHVDTNQNGSLDRLVDEKFGALDDGSLCVQFEHGQGDAAQCNEVASQAKSLVLPLGDELDTLWKIPKAELGRGARSASVVLELFNSESQKSTFLPAQPFYQVYALRFGRAASVDGLSVASPPASNPLPTRPPAVKTASPPADKPVSPPVTDAPTLPPPPAPQPVISSVSPTNIDASATNPRQITVTGSAFSDSMGIWLKTPWAANVAPIHSNVRNSIGSNAFTLSLLFPTEGDYEIRVGDPSSPGKLIRSVAPRPQPPSERPIAGPPLDLRGCRQITEGKNTFDLQSDCPMKNVNQSQSEAPVHQYPVELHAGQDISFSAAGANVTVTLQLYDLATHAVTNGTTAGTSSFLQLRGLPAGRYVVLVTPRGRVAGTYRFTREGN